MQAKPEADEALAVEASLVATKVRSSRKLPKITTNVLHSSRLRMSQPFATAMLVQSTTAASPPMMGFGRIVMLIDWVAAAFKAITTAAEDVEVLEVEAVEAIVMTVIPVVFKSMLSLGIIHENADN